MPVNTGFTGEIGLCCLCVNGDKDDFVRWDENHECIFRDSFGTCWNPNDSLAEDEDDQYDEERYVMAFGERGDIG